MRRYRNGMGMLIFSACALLTGCVSTESIINSSPSNQAWGRYLRESPFSYSFSSNPYVTEKLAANIDAISLGGLDPRIARHIQATQQWTEDYPSYLRRALKARSEVHARVKGYEGVSTDFGEFAGRSLTSREASKGGRWVNGKLGYLFAWYLNESYAFSQAERAAAREMAPLIKRGIALSEEEYEINQSLGLASTNHLLRITKRR